MLVGTELSSFLTDVWENREYILGYVDTPGPTSETVEDRVYSIYAPNDNRPHSERDKVVYRSWLYGIRAPRGKMPWKRKIQPPWFFFDVDGIKNTVAFYRIYLNVKHDQVAPAFRRIMELGSIDAPQGARALPPQPIPQRLHEPPRNRPLMEFGGTIAGAKVADETAAFTGRPDKIVVYINKIGGALVAELLAREMGKNQRWYLPDIPPMTRFITWGVGIGPEVAVVQGVDQWEVGDSFGGLRGNLIAQALVECMTGWSYDELNMNVELSENHLVWNRDDTVGRGNIVKIKLPVRLKSRRTSPPIRQDFVVLVERLFRKNNIDPQKPWA